MKKRKFKLDDINIKSFVTDTEGATLRGGAEATGQEPGTWVQCTGTGPCI